MKGIDPPRIDLFLAKAYELLDTTVNGHQEQPRDALVDIATNTASLLKGLNVVVTENKERIDRIVANVEEMTVGGEAAHARRARQLRRQPEAHPHGRQHRPLTTQIQRRLRARCSRTRARRSRT